MKPTSFLFLLLTSISFFLTSCEPPAEYEFIIRNAMIYDGSGSPGYKGDLAVQGDSIIAVGDFHAIGKTEFDAQGKALAPGFINMLSWAPETLIRDGRSLSDLRQGVTLEVMGEGSSYGPFSEKMREGMGKSMEDLGIEVDWETLGGLFGVYGGKGNCL